MSRAIGKFVRRLSNTSMEAVPGSLSGSERKRKSRHKRSFSDLSESDSYPHEGSLHVVQYLGFAHVEDPKSLREAQAVIKSVRTSSSTHQQVRLLCQDYSLVVLETDGDQLLVSPLFCVQEVVRSLGDSVAVTFGSGRYATQCHVFQAHSSREVRGEHERGVELQYNYSEVCSTLFLWYI